MDKGSIQAIDWKRCYDHLQGIEAEFRENLFNAVFENFFPKNASLVSIDDCIIDNDMISDNYVPAMLERPFYFFDKKGGVYYSPRAINVNTKYILFDWKKTSKKDDQKLLYAKSSRRKLIAQDRARERPDFILLSEQQIERSLSGSLKHKGWDDDEPSDGISAFGEPHDEPEEIEEILPRNTLHCERLHLYLENYPPRLSFGVNADWNASKEKREELNVLLDGLARRYDLRHYRARYVYDYKKFDIQHKDGSSSKLVDSVTFKKSPCHHMFKPNYVDFRL